MVKSNDFIWRYKCEILGGCGESGIKIDVQILKYKYFCRQIVKNPFLNTLPGSTCSIHFDRGWDQVKSALQYVVEWPSNTYPERQENSAITPGNAIVLSTFTNPFSMFPSSLHAPDVWYKHHTIIFLLCYNCEFRILTRKTFAFLIFTCSLSIFVVFIGTVWACPIN